MNFEYKKEYDDYLNGKVIKNGRSIITQEEAAADLDYFMYLLLNASFSCLETYQSKTDELVTKYCAVKNEILQKSSIKIEDFFILLKTLISDIKDLHSHIVCDEKNLFCSFGHRKIPYFTDIFFHKEKDTFVFQNGKYNGMEITQNSVLSDEKLYFVPVCKDDRVLYKGVIFSSKNMQSMELEISANNQKTKLSFYRDACDPNHFFDNYYKYNKDTVGYWIFPAEYWDEKAKQSFWNSINKDTSDNKDIIFIDNRANFGGIPYEQMKVIFSLLGISKWFEEKKSDDDIDTLLEASVVLSYPVAKKFLEVIDILMIAEDKKEKLRAFWTEVARNAKDTVKIHRSTEKNIEKWEYNPKVKNDITFNGKIVLIFSNDTSSLGEVIYTFIKENLGYDNVKVIGTNSRGCVAYSNPFSYTLPNSNIHVSLTAMTDFDLYKTNYYKETVEGRGIIPDFWATNDKELEDAINYVINCNDDEIL